MKIALAFLGLASANLQSAIENLVEQPNRQMRKDCNKRNWPLDKDRKPVQPEMCCKVLPNNCPTESDSEATPSPFKGTALDGQLVLFTNAGSYGCWCDLENAFRKKSKGQPVNALDQACMDLHHGYNCITIDDEFCNPRDLDATLGEYALPLTAISPIKDFQAECQQANQGNTCGYRTCLVEAQFLITTYQPVFSGDQSWLDMWNDVSNVHQPDGTFDFQGTCFDGNMAPPCGPLGCGDKVCCGNYPYRKAYYNNKMQCCNDKISPLGTC